MSFVYKNRYWIGGGITFAIIGVTLYINRKKVEKLGSDVMEYAQNKVWDLVSEGKINTLHPKVRDKARELINRVEKELGIKLRVTSGFRTYLNKINCMRKVERPKAVLLQTLKAVNQITILVRQ
jgi:peptidoglycan L-alanyl-D-glutamate endopeptidase CwlK